MQDLFEDFTEYLTDKHGYHKRWSDEDSDLWPPPESLELSRLKQEQKIRELKAKLKE